MMKRRSRGIPKVVNALTVDVEDWHQLIHRKVFGQSVPTSKWVVENTHLILDLLSEYHARATFFVLGTVADQVPELVQYIHAEGHEVATHGFAHRRIKELGPDEFEADLCRSIDVLERITGEPVLGHRAAYFSLDGSSTWAFEIMVAAGLRYDSSLFPIGNPRNGGRTAISHPHRVHCAAGSILEFPLATARLFGRNLPIAGGSYLRTLPFAFIRRGIRALNQQGQMAVLYIHPYEFQEGSLALSVPTRSLDKWCSMRTQAFRYKWGRGRRQQNKLAALLSSFHFAPLCEMLTDGSEPQD